MIDETWMIDETCLRKTSPPWVLGIDEYNQQHIVQRAKINYYSNSQRVEIWSNQITASY